MSDREQQLQEEKQLKVVNAIKQIQSALKVLDETTTYNGIPFTQLIKKV